jgi:hypothetical protein
MYKREFKQRTLAILAAAVLAVATMMIGRPASGAGVPDTFVTQRGNPGVIPNVGPRYAQLSEQWWRWAFSFPAESVPFFNTGGPSTSARVSRTSACGSWRGRTTGCGCRGRGSCRRASSFFPMAENFDPCITGTTQPGVSVGYWLLLAPLKPGVHSLHFGSHSWGQDVTYVLYVTPIGR